MTWNLFFRQVIANNVSFYRDRPAGSKNEKMDYIDSLFNNQINGKNPGNFWQWKCWEKEELQYLIMSLSIERPGDHTPQRLAFHLFWLVTIYSLASLPNHNIFWRRLKRKGNENRFAQATRDAMLSHISMIHKNTLK